MRRVTHYCVVEDMNQSYVSCSTYIHGCLKKTEASAFEDNLEEILRTGS